MLTRFDKEISDFKSKQQLTARQQELARLVTKWEEENTY